MAEPAGQTGVETGGATWRRVRRTVAGQPTTDGAGVRLNRVIGGRALPDLDPFLLLDQFDTDDATDYIAGFPSHPHRGFETVTYMVNGVMRHEDNAGHGGLLRPGGVQWMTAGRGIVHSEMPEQTDGLMRGFQLWVNLPAKEKMRAPRYQNIEPEEVPEIDGEDGARVRVIAGEALGVRGPVTGVSVRPLYLDVALAPTARLVQPIARGHTAFCYVFEGVGRIGGDDVEAGVDVPSGTLAVLGDGDRVCLRATDSAARVLLVAARPLGEPIVRYGPFVMNTREQIHQAIRDFQAGRF